MLAPQLVGRLLSEANKEENENIRRLLRQCDEEGLVQNALVPTYHCMHTPGRVSTVVEMRITMLTGYILLHIKNLQSNNFFIPFTSN